MNSDNSNNLEQLLRHMQQGDESAMSQLAEWVLAEARRLAAFALREKYQPTSQSSVISGAVVKLIRSQTLAKAPNVAYLKAALYQAVTEVLIDYYRKTQRRRRGFRSSQLPPDLPWFRQIEEPNFDLVALGQALAELQVTEPRQSSVVHLKFFVGMTISQIADELNVSESTVESDWRIARAWLFQRLSD
jgi:RNA polymerase sigma-70 factor, ECF subfamily